MAVLQGKSREAVIRELQRTVSFIPVQFSHTPIPVRQNLDVNQAVNNLLSRDDDDGDGETSDGDHLIPAFFPSGGLCV